MDSIIAFISYEAMQIRQAQPSPLQTILCSVKSQGYLAYQAYVRMGGDRCIDLGRADMSIFIINDHECSGEKHKGH